MNSIILFKINMEINWIKNPDYFTLKSFLLLQKTSFFCYKDFYIYHILAIILVDDVLKSKICK